MSTDDRLRAAKAAFVAARTAYYMAQLRYGASPTGESRAAMYAAKGPFDEADAALFAAWAAGPLGASTLDFE